MPISQAFNDVVVLTRRNLVHISRQPLRLSDVTVQPVLFTLLFLYVLGAGIVLPHGSYTDYAIAGLLGMNLVTGRIRAKFFPLSPRAVLHDLGEALKGHLSHADPSKYNAVQKLAYLFVMLDIAVLILSGLAIWKSVQFPLLRELMGGYDNARIVHFCAMSLMAAFIVVHLVMVALVPRSSLAMLRGR